MGQWRLDFRNGRKELEHALHEFHRQIQTYRELNGVRGKPETQNVTILWSPFTPNGNAEISALWETFGNKHGWLVTKDNKAVVLQECLELTAKAAAMVPLVDKLRDPEVDEKNQRERVEREKERQEKSEQCAKAFAAVMAKKPVGAECLIVAEYEEDRCDSQSDYFNVETTRIVAIGWRRGKKEDFRQLREAAGHFVETVSLKKADEKAEHRDNYSMGTGNYLKNGTRYRTGWAVRSHFGNAPSLIIEDALPGDIPPPAPPDKGKGPNMVEVRDGTKDSFVEVYFPAKPAQSVMKALYEAGFRFSRHGGTPHWWGKKENLPAEYAAQPVAPAEMPTPKEEPLGDQWVKVEEPVAKTEPAKEPEPEAEPEPDPAPQQGNPANRPTELHDLSQIRFRAKVWQGQCPAKKSAYLTDGRIMVLRKFADKELAKKFAAQRTETRYKDEPLKDEAAAVVMNSQAAEKLTVMGWLSTEEIEKLAGVKLDSHEAEAVLALSYTKDGKEERVYLDAHKYVFVQKLTGGLEEIHVGSRPGMAIFKKNGENAAIVMGLHEMDEIFTKALAALEKNGVKQEAAFVKREAPKVEQKVEEVKQESAFVKPDLRVVPPTTPADLDKRIRRLRRSLGI